MSGSACLKIGVFGGTFDPVHIGHLVVATEALAALRLDKVQFVLAGTPPHKPGQIVSSNEHRSAMLELAIAGRPGFELSDADLRREGPSYSADLLRAFRAEHPQDELYFIIGADSLRDFHTWQQPASIPKLAIIAVAGRPGVELDIDSAAALTPELAGRIVAIPIPEIGVSSTDIRQRVQNGRQIWFQTPIAVEQYIADHGLYRPD